MAIDLVGNKLSKSSFLGSVSGSYTQSESIGGTDKNDFYRFEISSRSSFDSSLTKLKKNANLYLLDSAGQTLIKSTQKGTASELISTNLEPDTYYIRVSSRSDKSTTYTLTLNSNLASSIQVNSPSANDMLSMGSDASITWTDNLSEEVRIDLYKGGIYQRNINTSTLSDGSETWSVPSNLESGSDYQIYIRSTTDESVYAYSDRYFTISAPPKITLTSPNKGSLFQAGSSYEISWQDNISENVRIDLYKNNAFHSTINPSTLSDGKERWTLPADLAAGMDYKIRISSTSNSNIYDESGAFFTIEPQPIQDSGNGFNISFDYRYDTNGWFTPEKKVALEAAAKLWENIILDEFEDVPAGSPIRVVNPQTGIAETIMSDQDIDDIVIFVGGRDLGGNTLGYGGPSGAWYVGSDLETRYTGNDFEPWTGRISFNTMADWFFDSTPATADDIPAHSYDFISVAIHEMGHVLGIGGSNAYNNWVSNGMFVGPKAQTQNYEEPIPLEYSEEEHAYPHIQTGYTNTCYGDPVMTPSIASGVRKLPSPIDIAILDDIGYSVHYLAPL